MQEGRVATESSSQTPPIRTFQMDGAGVGKVKNSVNLFRGDVNFSQMLFTLPGRSQADSVSVGVNYQSNVFRDATTWNADAPTGVLGLGWELPLSYIESSGQSPVSAQRTYTFVDEGSSNTLIRQSVVPPVFTMDEALENGLVNGQPVSSNIVVAFGEMGVLLDSSATVTGSGPWTIADEVNQQLFTVNKAATNLVVSDGGEYYQLQNYQFSKIVYYPCYERWLVVESDGRRRSFGGLSAKTASGYATSLGNSIAWSVWWTDASGIPAWRGASTVTNGQTQVARSWYQQSISNRFGSTVLYEYNGWARGSDGLIPNVDQLVGTGGLPFTKAMYLTGMTDPFGRKITFDYCDKQWGASEEDPREYYDPHQSPPSFEPSAYQDAYETQYLDTVSVADEAGNGVFTITFEYAPPGGIQGVANVTSNSGSLKGDTYKRFLTGIVLHDIDGVAQPPLSFSYTLDECTQGGQPGALASITYPMGAVASYTYSPLNLDLCNRTNSVTVPPGYTPRVFYGPDYSVVCFYNQDTTDLQLTVRTWEGTWLSWQIDSSSPTIDCGAGLDINSLDVLANENFFTVMFSRDTDSGAVYAFQRDTSRPGQWVPATVGKTVTGKNSPTDTFSLTNKQVSFSGGNRFFMTTLLSSDGSGDGEIIIYTYRWTNNSWEKSTVNLTDYTWVTAQNEYWASLDSNGDFSLNYLDGNLDWQSTSDTITITNTNDPDAIVITPGDALVVVSNLVTPGDEETVKLCGLSWNANYQLTNTTIATFTVIAQDSTLQATVVDDTLVALGSNVARFTGTEWLSNTSLNPSVTDATELFAYGPDVAIRLENDSDGFVLSFDPSSDSSSWDRTPVSPEQKIPLPAVGDNFPTVSSQDWLMLGSLLYYRGSSTNWDTVVGSDAALQDLSTASKEGFDSTSVVNQSPQFIAFAGSSSATAQAVVLKNGNINGGVAMLSGNMEAPDAPGTSLSGPSLFVTFTSPGGFEDATAFSLNQYAGQAVSGMIQHYPVVAICIDDGLGQQATTTIVPDTETAGCDPTGLIVKYFKSTVYPGTDSAESDLFGHKEFNYINGLNDFAGDNYHDMLDGLLVSTATYAAGAGTDDNPLSSTSVQYKVFPQVASDPVDASAVLIQLHGGWVAKESSTTVSDGVSAVVTYGYTSQDVQAPYTGQIVSQTATQTNGNGDEETLITTKIYSVEHYPQAIAIHAFSDVVQVTRQSQVGKTANVIASTVTPSVPFPSGWGAGVQVPYFESRHNLLTTTEVSFPFSTYIPGTSVPGWQCASRMLKRTPYGQKQEYANGQGLVSSILYSSDYQFQVARIGNASFESSAFLGFESYEDTSAWTLTNVNITNNDVRVGQCAAVLGADSTIQISLSPSSTSTLVVAVWYKTPQGLSGTAEISVTVSGQKESQQLVDTKGLWDYTTFPVTASENSSMLVSVNNTSSSQIVVDSVAVFPLPGSLKAQTFDAQSRKVMAVMDESGQTKQTFYDRAWRKTLSSNASGVIRNVYFEYLSRSGSTDGTFSSDSPNTKVMITASTGGSLETFREGGTWITRWNPTGSVSASNGSLTLSGTSSITSVENLAEQSALYFEAQASSDASISLTLGDWVVSYGADSWAATNGGKSVASLQNRTAAARHWMLVAGEAQILFFADGQLLYSFAGSFSSSQPTISTTGTQVIIRHLAILTGNRVDVVYQDGTSRNRQTHSLCGADCYILEEIYDALSRNVATTKPAPGSFGSGAQFAVMEYRDTFVDIAAFLGSSDDSMPGDVAQYWQGQSNTDGTVRSDDENYPYFGVRFEPSPRKRSLELGSPGKPYAINPTVSLEDRATVQFNLGTNAGGTLPVGEFFQTGIVGPNKSSSIYLRSKNQDNVFFSVENANSTQQISATAAITYAAPDSGPVSTTTRILPNSTTSGPQPTSDAFVSRLEENAISQTQGAQDADTGTTQFVGDSNGNPRFLQPALDSGETGYLYFRYDPLGRVIEEGVVNESWDRQKLISEADNNSFPSENFTVMSSTKYDGDGTVPSLLGKKVQTTTVNVAAKESGLGDTVTTTETFSYTSSGLIQSVQQDLSGAVTASMTVSYVYNTANQVVQINYPDGAPLSSVYYGFNELGQTVSVGTTAGASDLASYNYTAFGGVSSERIGSSWERLSNYDSRGEALSIKTANGNGTFAFEYTYNPDTSIHTRLVQFTGTNINDVNLSDTFSYDSRGQLKSATGSKVSYETYDPNGNLWQATDPQGEWSFVGAKGKNQLETVQLNGAPQSMTYNARGQLVSGMGRGYSYEFSTGKTTWISMGSVGLRLAYNSRQQRVLKQEISSRTETVYCYGAGSVPLLRQVDDAIEVLVYGPTGLLAIQGTEQVFPVRDNNNSNWAAVSQNAVLSVNTFLPFGSTTISEDAGLSYLFQGHEWDAEVGLYNFNSRMYDPVLRRFLSPDPKQQFPSPYVFAANNPLGIQDPSGDMSKLLLIGSIVGMAAVTVAGLALTVFSGGASDALAASIDEMLADEVVVEGVADAAAEGTTDTVDAAAEAGAAEGGDEAAGDAAEGAQEELGRGARARSFLRTALKLATTKTTLQVAGSTVIGSGSSGIMYDIDNGTKGTFGGLMTEAGWGAFGGLVGGTVGGLADLGIDAASAALADSMESMPPVLRNVIGPLILRSVVGGVSGAVGNDAGLLVANASSHRPITADSFWQASWRGGVVGAIAGGADASFGDSRAAVDLRGTAVDVGNAAADGVEDATNAVARKMNPTMVKVGLTLAVATFSLMGYDIFKLTRSKNKKLSQYS